MTSDKGSVAMLNTLYQAAKRVAQTVVDENMQDEKSGEKYTVNEIVAAFMSEPNADNDSPLHMACALGKKDMALWLYDKGATMCRKNKDGMDWLMAIICYRRGRFRPVGITPTDKREEFIESVPQTNQSSYGAPGHPKSAPDSVGWKIILHGRKCTVLRVREYVGCVPDTRKVYQAYMSTILHDDIYDEEAGIEEELDLEFAHDVVEFAWCIPWKAGTEENELMKALLDRGVDTAVKCNAGMTPLHYAARFDEVEVTRLLLKAGADVGAASNQCCAIHGKSNTRCCPRHQQGKTPLMVAEILGHTDVENLITEYAEKKRIENERTAEQLMLELIEESEDKNAPKVSKKKKKKKAKEKEPAEEEPIVSTSVEQLDPKEKKNDAAAKPEDATTDAFELEAEVEAVRKATAASTIADKLQNSNRKPAREVVEVVAPSEGNTASPWQSMSTWATIAHGSQIESTMTNAHFINENEDKYEKEENGHDDDDDDDNDELKPPSVMDFSSDEWLDDVCIRQNFGVVADGGSPEWLAACSERMQRLHPMASALGLGCEHILGYDIDTLSVAQIEAAEEVHRELLARLADARVRLAIEQERQRLSEAKDIEIVRQSIRRVRETESKFSA